LKRLSIKGVAGTLNFSSEFYFSHFFRHHTGMTRLNSGST
jgi:AraC-like DNA-binding protein